jgi:carbamoyl-phosphate synthase large subunit
MPLHPKLQALGRKPKTLLLGSGGLTIGQAGEFDYSGTQAVKALVECGHEVLIINPNIATVQTNPDLGVKVFLYPVEPTWVEKIIADERPDAIVAGFGGQTALNCLVKLDEKGVLERYNVINLGTSPATLRMTEDRDLFAKKMREINIPVPESRACSTEDAARKAAVEVGFPVIVRAAYACGGLGSGFASDLDELMKLVQPALASSPQVLIEKSLKGWKEVEYEVMRDGEGNTITICNMENFDPLGIHTGDSIVVCPSQSLSDDEYQMLRNAAIKIINACGVIGECNVQYALNPTSLEYVVIEVNARLSRSSALASKASGYPIAYIAAKVVQGFDLLEIQNPVTGITCAYFEPALDYVTIKVPRWDLAKFKGASRQLGSTMKSVGEIMAIGRSFQETLQKAVRMVTESDAGLSSALFFEKFADGNLEEALRAPTDTRLYAVISALRMGWDIERIHDLTAIDKWFLAKVQSILVMEKQIAEAFSKSSAKNLNNDLEQISAQDFLVWKKLGFSDQQIALVAATSSGAETNLSTLLSLTNTVRKTRLKHGIKPVAKRIDTTAAEYPCLSHYLYMTYHGTHSDPGLAPKKNQNTSLILGSGSYRVGTSVEFDWCAVTCSQRLRKANWRSVVVNCNPETVSTDFNNSDCLYFDEMSLERILDIVEAEGVTGVVASMGGQLPNRLALPLAASGVRLLGHSAHTIDLAEDRSKFSTLLDKLEIDQPRWTSATSVLDVDAFIERVGFPVLVRPSYVLSGAAMNVAYDRASLNTYLSMAVAISPDYPIVVSEFLVGAREIELDGVASNGKIITSVVSEHIENAGVHSGDATLVVPAQRLYVETVRRVKRAGHLIAQGLNLNGPFNIQFLARSNHIQVIECNARASRSFPFVSKVSSVNLAEVATSVMIGETVAPISTSEDDLPHVGVKAALFSFSRLAGADPVLGVEMTSTGEVGCIGRDFEAAYLLAMESSKIYPPKKGMLISAGPEAEKLKFVPWAKMFEAMGLPLYATAGTAKYLQDHGVKVTVAGWPGEDKPVDSIELIRTKKVDFVVNIPKVLQSTELTQGSLIRQAASQFGCSIITNMEKLIAYGQSLEYHRDFLEQHRLMSLPHYR